MEKKIAVIRGDGIGPEIIGEAVAVLDAVAALYGHTFTYDEVIMGGEACNRWGDPLPPEMLQKCLDKGVPAGHLLCMQGPFSTEMNTALIHENDIRYVLTKQSGRAGGYQQKVEAARQCRAGLVVILPPREAEGVSVKEMKEILLRCL